ncbi:hypothetical protein MML48_3g00009037 [Holotrichia oblita]|uniref:Uncharacterized protein n=1 Tax=Holotrichia oblita TaxID=644536 RepID=A0ACB9TFL9_HOLOL|nr:hypothetical protein MML48_3g00009037 [Holotrichia oblita]
MFPVVTITPHSTEVIEDSDTEITSQQRQGESLDSEIASSSSLSKGTISSYFDNMSSQEINKIDEILARAIYVSEAPLDMTTKKVWLDVFKTIRCAYKPPSRYQLSNPLLESEYTRVKTAVSSKISEAAIKLVISSEKSISGPVWWAGICSSSKIKDHSKIVEATEEEIEKEDIGFEVIALTQFTKEKEESDDEVGDDDEDDLQLSTLLRSPF